MLHLSHHPQPPAHRVAIHALVLSAALMLAACGQSTTTPPAAKATEVGVVTLKAQALDVTRELSGRTVEVAEANRLIEYTTSEQTVQTAIKEVADALAVRAQLDARLQAQVKRVDAYQGSLLLTERQYEAGSINALSVLDAQRSLYAAQQDRITLRLTEQGNRLALYKAMGGA
jgi:outer membrane protein TolC